MSIWPGFGTQLYYKALGYLQAEIRKHTVINIGGLRPFLNTGTKGETIQKSENMFSLYILKQILKR